jgi:hypothetical protein
MKTMPGAHQEIRENPTVRSKFDKSHGHGLPAPHLKPPGEVAKETGSSHPGHTENGHKLPVERSHGMGAITRAHHSPGDMGAPLLHGQGLGAPKNTVMTDANVVHSSSRKGFSGMHGTHEPDPVRAGGDLHKGQHNTGAGSNKLGGQSGHTSPKSARPQHQDNESRRSKEPHAKLDKVKMKGRSHG